ncbi:MAG: hypothetical protein ACLVL7_02055 [Anaerotruncus massiliensis (ex Togo et al. 2019)]
MPTTSSIPPKPTSRRRCALTGGRAPTRSSRPRAEKHLPDRVEDRAAQRGRLACRALRGGAGASAARDVRQNLIFKTGGADACHGPELMRLIEAGRIDTSLLITHRALNGIMEGYRVFEHHLDNCIKWSSRPQADAPNKESRQARKCLPALCFYAVSRPRAARGPSRRNAPGRPR